MKKFSNPVNQLRLEEAFTAATRMDEALEHAVARKFEDDGKYKATNPLELPLAEYVGVVLFAVFTFGLGGKIYDKLATEKKAAQDDYKLRVEKHVEVMNARLSDTIEKLPASAQKSLLQNFARHADYAFLMEKAAVNATASGTFLRGLSLVESAEDMMKGHTENPSYRDAYFARTFPKAGSFEAKLKDDLAQIKLQLF